MKHTITIEGPEDYPLALAMLQVLADTTTGAGMVVPVTVATPQAPVAAPTVTAAPVAPVQAPAVAAAPPADDDAAVIHKLTDLVRSMGSRGSEVGPMIQQYGVKRASELTSEQLALVFTQAQVLANG